MDETVVRRAQAGDEDAFGAIVNESIDRLFAIATLIARDRSLAEDAVQDALLRAWRDLPTLREPQRLGAWLGRLTVNATYDMLRKRRRAREVSPLSDEVAVHSSEPADAIDRTVLAWAYGQLPADQRAVVVLHYYVGLSLDEAAATLGIPPGTVRSRLHSALRALRALIGTSDGTSVPHRAVAR